MNGKPLSAAAKAAAAAKGRKARKDGRSEVNFAAVDRRDSSIPPCRCTAVHAGALNARCSPSKRRTCCHVKSRTSRLRAHSSAPFTFLSHGAS